MIDDFKNVFQQHLLNISEPKVLESFNDLSDEKKLEAISYVLSAYGFSSAYEFLLLISKYWLLFDSCFWINIVNRVNSFRAKHTLLDFFLMYTCTRDSSFFLQIGITEEELRSISKKKKFLSKPRFDLMSRWDKRLYQKIGMSKSQIKSVNSYKIIACSSGET